MPVIRINADGTQPVLHGRGRPFLGDLGHLGPDEGPVVVMIHGFKYMPEDREHCPHRNLLALHPASMTPGAFSWPRLLGFGTGHTDEGLAIAFGWPARGPLWQAHRRATRAGRALGQVLLAVRDQSPDRPIHIVAHSLGIEVAIEALHHLPAHSVDRIISMTGACYQSRVSEALHTPAGETCEFFDINSSENAVFDFLFERLVSPPKRGDRALGHGFSAPNAITLRLDNQAVLGHLKRLSTPIGPQERKICHWSSYTRPGIMRFYNDLLRRADVLTIPALRTGLPRPPAATRSRAFASLPSLPPLPFVGKPS